MSNEWMIITIGISCVLAATTILILVMTVIEALSFATILWRSDSSCSTDCCTGSSWCIKDAYMRSDGLSEVMNRYTRCHYIKRLKTKLLKKFYKTQSGV